MKDKWGNFYEAYEKINDDKGFRRKKGYFTDFADHQKVSLDLKKLMFFNNLENKKKKEDEYKRKIEPIDVENNSQKQISNFKAPKKLNSDLNHLNHNNFDDNEKAKYSKNRIKNMSYVVKTNSFKNIN